MKTQIAKLATGIAGTVLLLSASVPAQAQQIGSYSGRTADGNRIRFDIVSNAQGQLAIADLSLSFSAACGQTGTSIAQSWQFIFSKGLAITREHVKHVENNPQLYLMNNITFDGRKVTGTTEARLPVLLGGKSPNAVQLCVSDKQAFEATFQSADNTNPFDRPGHARLRTPERTAILEWSSGGVMHQELRKQ